MNSETTRTAAGLIPAVAYCRVSTEKQATEGTSLDAQAKACAEAAARHGGYIARTIRDEGVSGAFYATRKGIQEALRLVESGEAKMLVISDLDRGGRDVDAVRNIAARVYHASGTLVFADDGVIDFRDTMSRTRLTMEAMFAEWEKDKIRERTTNGRRRVATEKGLVPTRTASPYAYHVITQKDVLKGTYPTDQLGKYVVIEEQAAIVREVFRRVAGGESLHGVAKWLRTEGIPVPSASKEGPRVGRPSRPGGAPCWRQETLGRMVRNPVYKGTALWGRREYRTDESRAARGVGVRYGVPADPNRMVEIPAPAIVTPDLWQAVQDRIAGNKSRMGGNPARRYLLSGIVTCACCGAKWYGSSAKGGPWYCCAGKRDWQAGLSVPACTAVLAKAEVVNSLLADVLAQAAENPRKLRALLASARNVQAADQDEAEGRALREAADAARADLEKAKADELAAVKAQVAGIAAGADPGLYAALIADASGRRAAAQEALSRAEAASKPARPAADALPVTEAEAVTYLADLGRRLADVLRSERFSVADKRALLLEVVRGFVVHSRGERADITLALTSGETDVCVSS